REQLLLVRTQFRRPLVGPQRQRGPEQKHHSCTEKYGNPGSAVHIGSSPWKPGHVLRKKSVRGFGIGHGNKEGAARRTEVPLLNGPLWGSPLSISGPAVLKK